MAALARLLILVFVVQTIVYVSIALYSRSRARARLNEEWEEEGHTGDKDLFIQEGLEAYEGSLRRKLLLGIYIIPFLIIAFLVYVANFM